MIHLDEIMWACLVAEHDAARGRPFTPTPDTAAARALAAELLALPIDRFLLRLQQLHAKHERPADVK